MTMEPAAIAAVATGIAAVITALGGLLLQMRRVDPEDVKALRERLERAEARADAAEQRADRLEGHLLVADAQVFKLRQQLARVGILVADEADPDDVDPRNMPAPREPTP